MRVVDPDRPAQGQWHEAHLLPVAGQRRQMRGDGVEDRVLLGRRPLEDAHRTDVHVGDVVLDVQERRIERAHRLHRVGHALAPLSTVGADHTPMAATAHRGANAGGHLGSAREPARAAFGCRRRLPPRRAGGDPRPRRRHRDLRGRAAGLRPLPRPRRAAAQPDPALPPPCPPRPRPRRPAGLGGRPRLRPAPPRPPRGAAEARAPTRSCASSSAGSCPCRSTRNGRCGRST